MEYTSTPPGFTHGALASKAPCKGMVAELIETMKAEMKEYHIEVRLNTPATVETLRTLDPYGVVVACGGEQIVPNVPGADRSNVYYIEDVLMGRVSFEGKNIAVIGGGHVGLEVAHFLCDKNKVTVVEMQKRSRRHDLSHRALQASVPAAGERR